MKISIKLFLGLGLSTLFFACSQGDNQTKAANSSDLEKNRTQIALMLDSFNIAAAKSDFSKYFNYFTEDATFNGTDATENWDKKAFMVWARPYFEKNSTWDFTSIDRKIYFGSNQDIAWFDELLNTQMKICRGSGVVVKQNNEWKVQQYVLSVTIPNSQLDNIIKIKTSIEDSIISRLTGN